MGFVWGGGGGSTTSKQLTNLASRNLLIVFVFLPFFIQLPFPLLASFFLCGEENPFVR